MAEKTPGKPRKSTSSRKKEIEQKSAQKASTVTPIDQSSSRTGAHPSTDQSGVSPSVLNPRGSVQDGGHTAGVKPSGQELQERIRNRAYELFEQRGRREGYHEEDWQQAEAEVLAEFKREKSA